MAIDKGWIKLHRSSFSNQLYFSESFTKWQAWCDLLLLANHKAGVFNVRGIMVKVPRGSTGLATENIAKRWKWSRGKVERFLRFLESQEVKQIVRQKTRVTTLISIINYEQYQTNDTTNNTTNSNTDGHQTVQQTDINKNDKEEKEAIYHNTLVRTITQKIKNNGENFGSIENNASGEDLWAKRIRDRRAAAKD